MGKKLRKEVRDQKRELAQVVHRNIRSLVEVREKYEAEKSPEERLGDVIARFFGSLRFVRWQLVFLALWMIANSGKIGPPPFDPYPYPLLAMLTSVGALFVSVFVLIRQNWMAKMSERRADLDLQISLLSEHEITRLIHMVETLLKHSGAVRGRDESLEDLKTEVRPEAVIEHIEKAQRRSS